MQVGSFGSLHYLQPGNGHSEQSFPKHLHFSGVNAQSIHGFKLHFEHSLSLQQFGSSHSSHPGNGQSLQRFPMQGHFEGSFLQSIQRGP